MEYLKLLSLYLSFDELNIHFVTSAFWMTISNVENSIESIRLDLLLNKKYFYIANNKSSCHKLNVK